MKLHEIIELNGDANESLTGNSVSCEHLAPYKESLLTYYTALYDCEPVLMITSVFNVGAWGRIVPCDLLNECAAAETGYLGHNEEEFEACNYQEEFCAYETILFNSIMLERL